MHEYQYSELNVTVCSLLHVTWHVPTLYRDALHGNDYDMPV